MTNPGIHPNFVFDNYSGEEAKIIRRLSSEWYVTSSTRPISVSQVSVYRAFLCKAADAMQQVFDLQLEIITLFSSYDEFETRTIDGFEQASGRWDSLRTDPVCRMLISKDEKIVEKINNLLKNDPELPIIVPFTYNELLNNKDDYLVRNRFKSHFFSRDLFAFESPLKKDTYFFGRTGLINHILSRHKGNENSALFGLRRSGKTSIVFGIERTAKLSKQNFVSIDCQSPSVHKRRWNELLYYVLSQIITKYNLKKGLINTESYNDVNAADAFFEDIKKIFTALNRQPILISFDEIERISPNTATSKHWSEDDDFVLFWQSVRSAFQRHTGVFSFLLIGTNPKCVEAHSVLGHDNPIFNSVPISYIEGFDLTQTRDMVRKLGRYMGLKFDEVIFSKLHDDFGGHPYLIRHVCSLIHQDLPSARPVRVDKTLYDASKLKFVEKYANYTEMILDVLVNHFPDEYIMLTALACDDKETFDGLSDDPTLTNHLTGYGLIERGANGFYFKIESVRDHLRKKQRFSVTLKSNSERLLEVTTRRILLEPSLRRLVATILQARFGSHAQDTAEKYLANQSLKRLKENGFKVAFGAHSKDTNLSELAKIISGEWEVFKNMFTLQKVEFDFYIETIRKARTEEAHAGEITPEDFKFIRRAFSKIEDDLQQSGFLVTPT
jgi:hypothetical protein